MLLLSMFLYVGYYICCAIATVVIFGAVAAIVAFAVAVAVAAGIVVLCYEQFL